MPLLKRPQKHQKTIGFYSKSAIQGPRQVYCVSWSQCKTGPWKPTEKESLSEPRFGLKGSLWAPLGRPLFRTFWSWICYVYWCFVTWAVLGVARVYRVTSPFSVLFKVPFPRTHEVKIHIFPTVFNDFKNCAFRTRWFLDIKQTPFWPHFGPPRHQKCYELLLFFWWFRSCEKTPFLRVFGNPPKSRKSKIAVSHYT